MNIKKIIYERILTSIHKERIQKQRDFEKWIEENKITKEDKYLQYNGPLCLRNNQQGKSYRILYPMLL